MLKNLKVEQFIKETASNAPVPGGGSVAALTAALAAALSSMVFNITVGKKAYNELEEEKQQLINSSLKKSEALIEEYLNLMEMDAEVFQGWMNAFKLSKNTDEEINERKKRIAEASEKALQVPQTLARKAGDLYDIIELGVLYGSLNVISDAGVAAVLIHSAIESALINVKINLASVKDEKIKQAIISESSELIAQSLERKNKILNIMNEKL
jgi:formiminotetrahydrofolate cyclodeaminase